MPGKRLSRRAFVARIILAALVTATQCGTVAVALLASVVLHSHAATHDVTLTVHLYSSTFELETSWHA